MAPRGLSADDGLFACARGEWPCTPATAREGGGPALRRFRETSSNNSLSISALLREELADDEVGAVPPDVRGAHVCAAPSARHEFGVQQLTRDFFQRRRNQQVHAA